MSVDFTKTSWEEFNIDIDFSDRIPPGDSTLASATFSAKKFTYPKGSESADTTIFQSTTGTIISSVKARARVKAGTSGNAYRIICQAITTNGQKVEWAIVMRVEDH